MLGDRSLKHTICDRHIRRRVFILLDDLSWARTRIQYLGAHRRSRGIHSDEIDTLKMIFARKTRHIIGGNYYEYKRLET